MYTALSNNICQRRRHVILACYAVLSGLMGGGCSATMDNGGSDPATDARLTDLRLSVGDLSPDFDSAQDEYDSVVDTSVTSVRVTPTASRDDALIRVDGTTVFSGAASPEIALGDGATRIVIEIVAADGLAMRTYTIIVTREDNEMAAGERLEAYLKGSNTGLLDMFGSSVSIDRNTLVVGATTESSRATGVNGDGSNDDALFSGAAYVFVRNDGVWTQQAYLKASNTGESDRFGTRVAVSGDTIAVSAVGEASGATGINGDQSDAKREDGAVLANAGAVYVFTRVNGVWAQQAYIKASNTNSGDGFGMGLALEGDTLVVGAPGESSNSTGIDGDGADNSLASSGAAYVFTRDNEEWTQQAYIKASNTDSLDTFGTAVALYGDTLAVGAPGEGSMATGIDGDQGDNSLAPGSGAVYVFRRAGTTWAQEAYVKSSNNDTGIDGVRDMFGSHVALSENTLAVAATGEDSAATGIDGDQQDNSASRSGAVYVFTRDFEVWRQQAYLKAGNSEANDLFGSSLALDAGRLVVGATGEATQASGINAMPEVGFEPSSGAAYVFRRIDDVWSQELFIKASNPLSTAVFGTAVDVDGERLVIGAPGEDCASQGINGDQSNCSNVFGQDSGAAYVY